MKKYKILFIIPSNNVIQLNLIIYDCWIAG